MVTQAAAQSQPQGRALPSLIQQECRSSWEHVQAASTIDPFRSLLEEALCADTKRCIQECIASPQAVLQRRAEASASLCAIASGLEPARRKWAAALPDHSPARNFHLPLIQHLVTTLKYQDSALTYDLANGMPIAGDIPHTAGLTERPKAARQTLEQWRAETPTRNLAVIERVRKSQGTPLGNLCWEESQKEFQRGWLSPPVPLTDHMAKNTPLTPRYLIEQPGPTETKTRLIDDFKASGINGILTTADTNIPDNLDKFLAVTAYHKTLDPSVDLLAFSVDYKHAYKHVGICRGQDEFASILIAPPEGDLLVTQLRVLPFGSRRSPSNWARVTLFVQWVLLKLFRVVLAVYVDDGFCSEPGLTCRSAINRVFAKCYRFFLGVISTVSPSRTHYGFFLLALLACFRLKRKILSREHSH